MPKRRRPRSPFVQRRIALALLLAGGLLAGAGAAIRANSASSASGSYLLDVAGLFVVIAGAIVEARTAQRFLQATEQAARRRAIVLAAFGVFAALAGCVLASTVAGRDAPWSAAGAANLILITGFGAGLAGGGSLAWFYGGDYAARRIEQLSEEDW